MKNIENLALDVMNITCSYLAINDLAMIMRVSKRWHVASLTQWRFLLTSDFDVDPAVVKLLKYPNRIYFEIVKILTMPNLYWGERWDKWASGDLKWPTFYLQFIELYGINTFCFCLGVEASNEFDKFFKNNVQPAIHAIAALGNAALVKYYVENLGIYPAQDALINSIRSGSVTSTNFLINECGLSVTKGKRYLSKYPSKLSMGLCDKTSYDLKKILDRAAHIGALSIVEYFIEDKQIAPTVETLNNAARSGSVRLLKYLIQKFNSIKPDDETLRQAILSGSLSVTKFLIEECKILPTDSLLTTAAEQGLLPNLKYLINSRKLLPNKKTLDAAARSNFVSALRYLIREKNLQPDQTTLKETRNVIVTRYLVEEEKLIPTQETTKNTREIDSKSYLEISLKHPNKSYSFWNSMLSSKCTNTIEVLGRAILFNGKQVQQWPVKSGFRNCLYYANLMTHKESPSVIRFLNPITGPDYSMVLSTHVSGSAHKVIALTPTLYEILVIIQNVINEKPLFSKLVIEAKLYLPALNKIQARLAQALQEGDDDQKVLDFYKQWHGTLSNAIASMDESQQPEISAPYFIRY